MSIGLLITIVVASLCWVVAGRKGRNRLLWTTLCILIGPLPLVAVALLPRRKVATEAIPLPTQPAD